MVPIHLEKLSEPQRSVNVEAEPAAQRKRATLKRRINDLSGSALVEERIHQSYGHSSQGDGAKLKPTEAANC